MVVSVSGGVYPWNIPLVTLTYHRSSIDLMISILIFNFGFPK